MVETSSFSDKQLWLSDTLITGPLNQHDDSVKEDHAPYEKAKSLTSIKQLDRVTKTEEFKALSSITKQSCVNRIVLDNCSGELEEFETSTEANLIQSPLNETDRITIVVNTPQIVSEACKFWRTVY